MDLSALHGERLAAAVLFLAATLVLAVQLITPSPVVVSVGENGAQTTELGQYFTYADAGVIAVSAALLGASGAYLLVADSDAAATASRTGDDAAPSGSDGAVGRTGPPATPVGDGAGAQPDGERGADRQRDWEDWLDRLGDNEEAVFAVVREAGGEVPQRDVVAETDLSKATVSRTLDTLESKGLVERKRHGMGNVVVLQ